MTRKEYERFNTMTKKEYDIAMEEAQGDADPMLFAAFQRILTLEAALVAAKEVLETAMQYFPKSIKNSDRFNLVNVLANVVKPAIDNSDDTDRQ